MIPLKLAAAAVPLAWAASPALAAPIPVPNYSFENPTTLPPASPVVADWSTADPTPLEVAPGVFVNDGAIIFPNTAPGSPDRISNPDGNQIAGVGAEAGNAFFQLLPTAYAAGQQYSLTAAVGRSFGSPPAATAALRLALYYVDGGGQRQLVTSADVANSAANGLSANLLKDFGTPLSAVLAANSPAVGKPVGVLLTALGPTGGYFDVDNVRVTAVPEPAGLGLAAGAAGLLAARRRRRSAAALSE